MGGIVTAWMELAGKMITDGVSNSTKFADPSFRAKAGPTVHGGSWIPAFAGMTAGHHLPTSLVLVVVLGICRGRARGRRRERFSRASYASIFFTTLPATSVRRNSRPICL